MDEGGDGEPNGLDVFEAALAESTGVRPSKVSARLWLPVALPLLGAAVGALVMVVVGSNGGDAVYALLLLPYLAVIGALGGAVVGGVAALILFRVLRR